jgi:hypothetical protein
MAFEDLEIRITRSGKIIVKTSATSEQEITDLRRFLEETIGPIEAQRLTMGSDDDEAMARLRADRQTQADQHQDLDNTLDRAGS